MDRNFQTCVNIILREEGGNDDDPRDHGGRTSRGIIQRVWDAWRKEHPGLPEDVWAAPQDQIVAIYKKQYWEPYCGRLPSGLDLVFFDFCVNAGRQQAVKTLQRAIGVEPDGMMGVVTWQTVEAEVDLAGLVKKFSARRRAFYQALKQYPIFGKGWMARTNRVEQSALKLVKKEEDVIAHAPLPPVVQAPKADPADIKQPPVSTETATQVGAGAGLLGLLTWLWERFEQLSEGTLNKLVDLAQKPQFWFVAAMIGIFVYIWWTKHQQRKITERI